MAVPTRQTSEQQLNQWNQQLRASPLWQEFIRSQGFTGGRPVNLSDSQQRQLEQLLARNGMRIPDGMHIDPAGNLNQKNRLLRNVGIGAAIGGGALTGLGLAGLGPLSGLGGASAASGAAGGVLPSSSLPVSGLMGGAPAIASQGVSAGMAGVLPSAAIPGAMGAMIPAIANQGVSNTVGRTAAGAAGGIGNALAGAGKNVLGNLLSPEGLGSLAPLIAALANQGGNDNSEFNNAFLNQAYADAKRTNAMAETRYRRVDPLHQAVSQLAFNRLPINSRQGIQYQNRPLSE